MTDTPAVVDYGGKKARIALAGVGRWSQGWHLPNLHTHPNAEIAGLVSSWRSTTDWTGTSLLTREELEKKYNCPTFKTMGELIAAELDIDGIIIATSHGTHVEVGKEAASAGYHIFMEKPLSTDVAEAKDIVEQVEKLGKVFMVNNTANWRKNAKLAHDWVAAGEVGEVKHVTCFFGSPLGTLFENPEAGGWVEPTGTAGLNGFGWGQMAHLLGWVLQVTQLEPETVIAQMVFSEASGADIYDSASVMCKGGAVMSVSGCGVLPTIPLVESDIPVKPGEDDGTATKQIDTKIFGTKGAIFYSGYDLLPDSGSLQLRRINGTKMESPGFEFENYDQHANNDCGPESLLAFVDACLDKHHYNGASGIIGMRCVQVIDAMYRSVKAGGVPTTVA